MLVLSSYLKNRPGRSMLHPREEFHLCLTADQMSGFVLTLSMLCCTVQAATIQSTAQTNSVAPASNSIFARIVPDDCMAPSRAELAEVRSAAVVFHRQGNQKDELRALALLGT